MILFVYVVNQKKLLLLKLIVVFRFFFFLVCIEPLLRVSECLFFFPISVPLVFPFLISSLVFFSFRVLLGERGDIILVIY